MNMNNRSEVIDSILVVLAVGSAFVYGQGGAWAWASLGVGLIAAVAAVWRYFSRHFPRPEGALAATPKAQSSAAERVVHQVKDSSGFVVGSGEDLLEVLMKLNSIQLNYVRATTLEARTHQLEILRALRELNVNEVVLTADDLRTRRQGSVGELLEELTRIPTGVNVLQFRSFRTKSALKRKSGRTDTLIQGLASGH